MDPATWTIFVFTVDGEVLLFDSIDAASGWMEAIDVDDGEYAAGYTLEGHVVHIGTGGDRVVLTVTDQEDPAGLRALLHEHGAYLGLTASADDPRAVANELRLQEWERRWPRRPRWLARRLHGDGPAPV